MKKTLNLKGMHMDAFHDSHSLYLSDYHHHLRDYIHRILPGETKSITIQSTKDSAKRGTPGVFTILFPCACLKKTFI